MSPCFLTLYVVKVGGGYQIRGRRVFEGFTDCVVMTHKHYESRLDATAWARRYVRYNKNNFIRVTYRLYYYGPQRPAPEYPGLTVKWIDDVPGLDTHDISHIKVVQ